MGCSFGASNVVQQERESGQGAPGNGVHLTRWRLGLSLSAQTREAPEWSRENLHTEHRNASGGLSLLVFTSGLLEHTMIALIRLLLTRHVFGRQVRTYLDNQR